MPSAARIARRVLRGESSEPVFAPATATRPTTRMTTAPPPGRVCGAERQTRCLFVGDGKEKQARERTASVCWKTGFRPRVRALQKEKGHSVFFTNSQEPRQKRGHSLSLSLRSRAFWFRFARGVEPHGATNRAYLFAAWSVRWKMGFSPRFRAPPKKNTLRVFHTHSQEPRQERGHTLSTSLSLSLSLSRRSRVAWPQTARVFLLRAVRARVVWRSSTTLDSARRSACLTFLSSSRKRDSRSHTSTPRSDVAPISPDLYLSMSYIFFFFGVSFFCLVRVKSALSNHPSERKVNTERIRPHTTCADAGVRWRLSRRGPRRAGSSRSLCLRSDGNVIRERERIFLERDPIFARRTPERAEGLERSRRVLRVKLDEGLGSASHEKTAHQSARARHDSEKSSTTPPLSPEKTPGLERTRPGERLPPQRDGVDVCFSFFAPRTAKVSFPLRFRLLGSDGERSRASRGRRKMSSRDRPRLDTRLDTRLEHAVSKFTTRIPSSTVDTGTRGWEFSSFSAHLRPVRRSSSTRTYASRRDQSPSRSRSRPRASRDVV